MRQNHRELCQLIAASFRPYVHFVRHPLARSSCTTLDLPFSDIPIEAFKTCIPDGPFSLQLAPQIIALVFGELFSPLVVTISRSRRVVSEISAFGIMIFFACHGSVSFRFSSILRAIVGDATVYFIMAIGLQTLVLLFLTLANVCRMSPLPIEIPLTHSPLE
jgi:hypothetical protein